LYIIIIIIIVIIIIVYALRKSIHHKSPTFSREHYPY